MSLFQESIIRKHLGYLDQEVVDKAYLRFKEVYSANKIINIKVAKEEQYQEGFIKDIFGAVLGYSVFPEQPFNIQTEKKNESDSKKADGAIFQGENVVGVIELKDNKTKNLDAVKDQAFGYKNNHKDCSYVISSNFHKLRFYLDDATDYEEFDLYNLDKETFKRFYLYLHKEGLLDKNIPRLLRQETKFHEENITKSLYKDYSSFKNSFFQNVVKNNPQHDKLLLFVKSQKFLDKVLFVLFAEDKGLVATNSIVQIVEKWQNLKNDAFDTPKPLYELVALFFNNLFIGKKDQKGGVLIPEFGGEIFAPDEVLDTLLVDDDVLKDDLLKLSKYDFNTDVDVNILGHIFEHSLSEIEEVEAELKGEVADKTKGKRKKDGVFYTPKYITKYIVENTIGKLCNEKKAELKLDIDIAIFEFQKTDGKLNAKGIELYTTLNKYKDWLLTLKILDPACGSGAFLNQAVNFLIQEHKFVDDIIAELTNSPLRLFDTDIAILENNIYGVDINEESIEIAKLSLWLRTAKQGRKLSNLSNNIKCGNSLIDDPAVAGGKAFNWQKEFPEVFANGGFDVVIGNPPYIKEYTNKSAFDGLHNHPCYQGKMDLWYFFGWLGLEIVKPEIGLIGFIAPNNWITNSGASVFRNIVLQKGKIIEYVDFGDFKVFDSAGIQTMIYIMANSKNNKDYKVHYSKVIDKNINHDIAKSFLAKLEDEKFNYFNSLIQKDILKDKFILFTDNSFEIVLNKIENNEVFYLNKGEVAQGIVSPQDCVNGASLNLLGEGFEVGDGIFNLSNNEYEKLNLTESEKELVKPFYTSKELAKYYGNPLVKYWVIYTDSKFKNENEILPFSNLKNHLDKFKNVITSDNKPYGLHRAREERFFKGKKILSIRKAVEPTFTYIEFDSYVSQSYYLIQTDKIDLKALVVILNSTIIKFWLKYKGKMQGDIFQIDKEPLLSIPISKPKTDIPFIEKADKMLFLNKELQEQSQKFQRSLERKFAFTELPKKLQDWYLLSYAEFIKELEKKKIKLSLNEEAEWETYFTTEAKKALELKAQIAKTDKEIDQMVYALYELTEDEIKIVEGN
jgi:hypothetical protein